MPNATTQFTDFSYSFSPEARKLRDQLPKELLPKLLALIDNLAINPDAFPEQTRRMGRSGEMWLYTDPDTSLEVTYEIDRNNGRLYFVHFAARIVELKRVFVSYCHKDQEWLDKLRKFLTPLERQGLIGLWADTKIQQGSKWREEIEKALESAKMAVLLVTPDFLDSDFIQRNELPFLLARAKQQGVQIIWIAVKSCLVNRTPINDFQAANNPEQPLEGLDEAQRNKVLTEICEKIAKAAAA